MDSLLKRRSIRKFTDQPVSDAQITKILEAAMAAPSAGNQQPWQFVVINDRKILDDIPNHHPYASMMTTATAGILVCGDLDKAHKEAMWVQDCSAATQNILIAIQSLGLGGVWLGVYPRGERVEAMKKLFDTPERIMPFSLVACGYPGEEKPPSDRYDQARIHLNKW